VGAAIFIAALILVIFAVDIGNRWWRENEWRRRWRERERGDEYIGAAARSRGPSTRVERSERSLRTGSIEIEIAHRLGDRLLFRLTQRLLEPLRQRIPAALLGVD